MLNMIYYSTHDVSDSDCESDLQEEMLELQVMPVNCI